MLNMIKDIINEKKSFQETAEFLMEDESIDDSIILGEDSEDLFNDVPKPSEEFNEEESNESEEPKEDEGEEPKGGEEPAEEPKEEGREKSGEEAPETQAPEGGSDDVLDIKIDEEEPAGEVPPTEEVPPVEGELPNPVGAQTGEPANAGDEELTSVEINPATNTMSDVLPIPPANASDAVASDDLLDTNIDSGFEDEKHDTDNPGSEGSDDLLDMPIDSAEPNEEPVGEAVDDKKIEDHEKKLENDGKKVIASEPDDHIKTESANSGVKNKKSYDCLKKEINSIKKKYKSEIDNIYNKFSNDIEKDEIKGILDKAGFAFMEAITLGEDNADPSSDNSGDDTSSSTDATTDGTADASADSLNGSEGDNEVTSAVKDKVDEISSDDANMFGGNMDEELTKNKEAVLKKLSSITKSIEDTKNAILSNM